MNALVHSSISNVDLRRSAAIDQGSPVEDECGNSTITSTITTIELNSIAAKLKECWLRTIMWLMN